MNTNKNMAEMILQHECGTAVDTQRPLWPTEHNGQPRLWQAGTYERENSGRRYQDKLLGLFYDEESRNKMATEIANRLELLDGVEDHHRAAFYHGLYVAADILLRTADEKTVVDHFTSEEGLVGEIISDDSMHIIEHLRDVEDNATSAQIAYDAMLRIISDRL